MTKKVLLGLTLVAVLAMAVAFPAVADAITSIKKTEIKVKNDEIKKLKFQLTDKVPKTPFGGYAIFTDAGDVIAITSHGSFFDSTGQQAPTADQVALQVGGIAAICTVSDEACGSEWHVHLVKPANPEYGPEAGEDLEGTPICGFAAVGELTYTEPSEKLNVAGKHLLAKNIDIGTEGFVGALSGNLLDFTVGTPLEGGQGFDLEPVFLDPEDITTLQAVCIVPTP